MAKNPYTGEEIEFTQEQWEKILGKYRYQDVSNPEEVWEKIKNLEPYNKANSLHIMENCFELDGVKYRCLWTLDQESDIPFEITTIHPQRQFAPEQIILDLE